MRTSAGPQLNATSGDIRPENLQRLHSTAKQRDRGFHAIVPSEVIAVALDDFFRTEGRRLSVDLRTARLVEYAVRSSWHQAMLDAWLRCRDSTTGYMFRVRGTRRTRWRFKRGQISSSFTRRG